MDFLNWKEKKSWEESIEKLDAGGSLRIGLTAQFSILAPAVERDN